jgi:prepilin-type processing-associated H-X9-DG protein
MKLNGTVADDAQFDNALYDRMHMEGGNFLFCGGHAGSRRRRQGDGKP